MKKILLVCMLTLSMSMQAQEVFNELRQKNKAIVENQQNNEVIRQISQFKLDALNYLVIKMQEEMPDSSAYYLDVQAYSMNAYVTLYIKKLVDLSKMPQALQEEMTRLFMETTRENPLFKDKDKDLVLSYYRRGECITRFSLDTDWEKALEIISKIMEDNK